MNSIHDGHRPIHWLPELTSGLVTGILVVILQISFAALIFSGDLSIHLSQGIGITLVGAFCVGLVIALTSSFRGSVACLQGSPAVVMALIASSIAAGMPASASPEDRLAAVVVAIGLTSLLTGLFFFGLGWFKLGSLVRFVPYPVSGGFLAGTGLLLVQKAMGVMTESPSDSSSLPRLFEGQVLVTWLPGVGFAVVMLVIGRRYRHYLTMPLIVAFAVLTFYLVLALTGTSLNLAREQGFLLGPFPAGALWQPVNYVGLLQADWSLIFSQTAQIGTILLIGVVSLLLNASGLELIVQRDIDLNRELRATGIANLVSGFGGSPVGYLTLSLSVLGHKLNPGGRFTGAIASGVCLLAAFLGAGLLSYMPRPVVGGLLFFLGLSFLIEWVYDAWFKMVRSDYLIVLAILLVIAVKGFLDGVVFGLVIAVILFVIKYSSVDVVKQALSGVGATSNVDRPIEHRRILRTRGEEIFILRLQGYIFFGTAHNLYQRVWERAHDGQALRYVVLDFARVTGLDSSGEICFSRMLQLVQSQGVMLAFAQVPPDLMRQLERTALMAEDPSLLRVFPDRDHAIEWCENQILSAEKQLHREEEKPLAEHLAEVFSEKAHVEKFMSYLERRAVKEESRLMRQGESSDGLYFIESGQLVAELEVQEESPEDSDGLKEMKAIRLRAMRAGTVVGEVSMYLGTTRTASVVASKPSVLYYLSAEALTQMERNDPELASAFHQFIARMLAERLSDNNRAIQALSD